MPLWPETPTTTQQAAPAGEASDATPSAAARSPLHRDPFCAALPSLALSSGRVVRCAIERAVGVAEIATGWRASPRRAGTLARRSPECCHRDAMTRWPDDWADRVAGRDCVMCAGLGRGDNDHTVAVATRPYSEVGLHRRSALPGYCVVVWRHGHVAEPTALAPDAAAGYWRDVLDVARAVQAEFRPVKLNLLTLGNTVPHLHTHVLPRHLGDPAPGGPIAWHDIFTAEPTAVPVLRDRAAALRRRLELFEP